MREHEVDVLLCQRIEGRALTRTLLISSYVRPTRHFASVFVTMTADLSFRGLLEHAWTRSDRASRGSLSARRRLRLSSARDRNARPGARTCRVLSHAAQGGGRKVGPAT